MEGHEADNLIVAYAQPALEKSMEAAVVSADKDLMQLVPRGGELYEPMAECRSLPAGAGGITIIPAKRPPLAEAFFNNGFLKKRAPHFRPASFVPRQARRETSPSWPGVRDISSINRRKHSASGLRRLRNRRI